MEIEKLYRHIISEEMRKEPILKIYGACLDEKIKQRVQRMISGIESVEINDGLIINGYHIMSSDEVVYNKYKNIDVPVDGQIKGYCLTNLERIVVNKTQIECMSSKEVYKLKVTWENK